MEICCTGQHCFFVIIYRNSDLWKQKIKASQYWSLVYASKIVTVYGGAYETITIDGYYGSFTTNADGSVSHVVPIDTITLTGSVSGQSFTRTVTSDTTDVYVMPEGALYWYGNELTSITGGWVFNVNRIVGGDYSGTIVKNTNSYTINNGDDYLGSGANCSTKNLVNLSEWSHVKMFASSSSSNSEHVINGLAVFNSTCTGNLAANQLVRTTAINHTYNIDVSSITDSGYVYANVFTTNDGYKGSCTLTVYSVWLE